MKGDFTRVTFKSEKHYSGVRMQQGRVLLDADFNEYVDIQAHLNQIEARDVIGPCGAPQDNAGFEIDVTPDGGDLTIAPGRIYVDGILCQSEKLSVPIVAFPAAYQVQVATLTLENGQQFTTGQWIEVLVADTEPQLARIVDVNPEERILTYETLGEGELPLPAEGTEAQVRLVMTYNHQPDYPTPELVWDEETLAEIKPGIYLAYLDVWQRHITALEDAAIREVALGGPDTTTRTKTVWQVKLLRAGDGPFNCASEMAAWQEATAHSSGQLRARAEPETTETDPCVVPARAGYRGLENQLYRVEVHRVDSDTEITIKWSRENGSVVARWDKQDSQDANKLTVSSAGRDEVLGFAPDDWIELTDDTRELHGKPGLLVQITKVDGKVLTIDPGTQTVDIGDFAPTRKVRRWDMPSETGEIIVNLTETDNWIELENGIEVAFEPGTYHTGDYWLIPARTATRDIEWPRDGNVALPQSSHGIHHHYCRLAVLSFYEGTWERIHDCRKLFPPLTELIRFFHVSGDGQEAMPGELLPRPLQVGVANDRWPIEGAKVAFRVVADDGQLQAPGAESCPDFPDLADSSQCIVVKTGPDGVAECEWRLDALALSQQVEATLLEIDGKPMVDGDGMPFFTPIRFNANLSIASQVAYDSSECPRLQEAGVSTVQKAIDVLCQVQPGGRCCCVTVGEGGEFSSLEEAIKELIERGQREICICLLPGELSSPWGLTIDIGDRPGVHLAIKGCAGSRVIVQEPWMFRGLASFALQDLEIVVPELGGSDAFIGLDRCGEVSLTSCRLLGMGANGGLLGIRGANRIYLENNVIDVYLDQARDLPAELFGRPDISKLFSIPSREQFSWAAFELGERVLTELPLAERESFSNELMGRVKDNANVLTTGEQASYAAFARALRADQVNGAVLGASLLRIRDVAAMARPGTAIIIADGNADTTLKDNHIIGTIGLYGIAPPVVVPEKKLEKLFTKLAERLNEGKVTLLGSTGVLQMRGNILSHVVITQEMHNKIVAAVDQEGVLDGLFRAAFLAENSFEAAIHPLLALSLSLTANTFDPVSGMLLAKVIGETAISVGNRGPDPESYLVHITQIQRSEQAANLLMTIRHLAW